MTVKLSDLFHEAHTQLERGCVKGSWEIKKTPTWKKTADVGSMIGFFGSIIGLVGTAARALWNRNIKQLAWAPLFIALFILCMVVQEQADGTTWNSREFAKTMIICSSHASPIEIGNVEFEVLKKAHEDLQIPWKAKAYHISCAGVQNLAQAVAREYLALSLVAALHMPAAKIPEAIKALTPLVSVANLPPELNSKVSMVLQRFKREFSHAYTLDQLNHLPKVKSVEELDKLIDYEERILRSLDSPTILS